MEGQRGQGRSHKEACVCPTVGHGGGRGGRTGGTAGRGDTARWGLRVGGFGRERGGRGGGVGLAQVRWRCRVGLARYGDRAAPFCLFCFLGIFGPKFL